MKKTKCYLISSGYKTCKKKLTRTRFIIAASKCSLKPSSKSAATKTLFYQIEGFNNQFQYFTGISSFWTSWNNQPIIKGIDNIS